uniref:Uncharacterized protein n=1 Tax=Utricularia reniformis TaxID=192314 RepID=A0A1Y0B466_9LAMI|nr:hypothetical protein AEK19_MT2017 [Utricularia reniformis]ART32177.1 hypothetical protein AEK19_MT2017 [Utricularia reniformis]
MGSGLLPENAYLKLGVRGWTLVQQSSRSLKDRKGSARSGRVGGFRRHFRCMC